MRELRCMCGAPDCPSCGVAQGTYYCNLCDECNQWEEDLYELGGHVICRRCARAAGYTDDEIEEAMP